jgi:hypothetical protein
MNMIELIAGFVVPGNNWRSWFYFQFVWGPQCRGGVIRVLGFHLGIRIARVG